MLLYENTQPWGSGSHGMRKVRNNPDCLFMLIGWWILYAIYDKCLHLLLRRMHYGVIKRRRIIDALWCTGFTLLSAFYLRFFVPKSVDSACIFQKPRYLELGITFHKSFYLHRAGVEIVYHGGWLRGWTTLMFCLIIHSSSQLKWFDIIMNLLFFKATSTSMLNICRILSTIRTKKTSTIVKILLGIYFVNLVYVHTLVVPDFTLWNARGLKNDVVTLICMWLWLFLEFLNEVRSIRLGYLNADKFINSYLFVPPSEGSIQLREICKKLRESSSDKIPEDIDSKKSAQLWQTLSCAMIMKKKLKRLRAMKENLSPSATS
ncbi:uncharacterized protein LOC107048704 [Diachasma alloeum]|uniref:uncharacterized protein LOC107048704 n=1 Tax=Diachasma alloeum TaxID=454923 RepID=UPI00073850F6|nr:uncharacterized protein LOC107048704 [Diachasma alloeum]